MSPGRVLHAPRLTEDRGGSQGIGSVSVMTNRRCLFRANNILYDVL